VQLLAYVIGREEVAPKAAVALEMPTEPGPNWAVPRTPPPPSAEPGFSIFTIIAYAEWDTLLFFYGVLLSVGGLATLGYLELASSHLYGRLGPTAANTILGMSSAIVDNIPIMYAVLQMHPVMDHAQWLLITLTCGVGGSLLSIGSAAGVALMGQLFNPRLLAGLIVAGALFQRLPLAWTRCALIAVAAMPAPLFPDGPRFGIRR